MTTDKSMQMSLLYQAYNDLIDLVNQPKIEYVSVSMQGRAVAIMLTAGVPVKGSGRDVDSYFRRTPKQRSDIWMSGTFFEDGFGHDGRVCFGQREAPVLMGRQSTFLKFAICKELARLSLEYATRSTVLLEWLAERSKCCEKAEDMHLWTALFVVLMFVDDVSVVSFDDPIFDHKGDRVMVMIDGFFQQQTRAWLYHDATRGVMAYFGTDDSEQKAIPPREVWTFLGIETDVVDMMMLLPLDKRARYTASCVEARAVEPLPSGGRPVDHNLLNALVHKLLHAATCIVLGRQHLYHLMRALKASNRLDAHKAILMPKAVQELLWWEEKLGEDARIGVPLASRSVFPSSATSCTIWIYSDASRELNNYRSSGFGAWCVIGNVFMYIEGRWTPWEVETLSINVLEYAAMNFGTFTFVREARAQGAPVTHTQEFCDNSAAESVAERGRAHTPEFAAMTRVRFETLREMGVYSTVGRITTHDNDVADGLSRGDRLLEEALRMAFDADLVVRRLSIKSSTRDIQRLFREEQEV